jgi:hypothetical protein
MHHHKYSEDIPYPPLNLVLSAPLWAWEEYGLLRAKLQSPVPNPVVLESTDAAYLTIDAIHRTVQDSSSASDRCVKRQWMQWGCGGNVCLFLFVNVQSWSPTSHERPRWGSLAPRFDEAEVRDGDRGAR